MVAFGIILDAIIRSFLTVLYSLINWIQKKVGEIVTRYQATGVKVVVKVELGHIAKKILSYVTENSIDLIVMGSHGARGLREYVVGSNAEKIVRSSPVPVPPRWSKA